MRNITNLSLVGAIAFVLVVAPADADPKYHLKDCVVRVNLLWSDVMGLERRHETLSRADEFWKRATVSGNYPLFSLHYTREAGHYFAYFADQCEKRESLTKDIIDNDIKPNVPGFPDYTVSVRGFKIGEDGVVPSGWWRDE